MANYYDILNVPRDADAEAIKRAYRQLALRYHPDRNPGSEERFRAVTEAYHVLSSPERRALYDIQGQFAPDFEPHNVLDLFEALEIFVRDFGSGIQEEGARVQRQPSVALAGAPREIRVKLSLRDVVQGTVRELRLPCSACGGTGGEGGDAAATVLCTGCGGTGVQRRLDTSLARGARFSSTPCDDCAGTGRRTLRPCLVCEGRGHDIRAESFRVEIPPGVESGDRIRVEVPIGENGATVTETVHVVVDIPDDEPPFQRRGRDILVEVPVTYAQAVLGVEIDVPTLAGVRRLRVPPGIQSGNILRITGFGLPSYGRDGTGDQLVRVVVVIPQDLSVEELRLVRRLENAGDRDRRPWVWAAVALSALALAVAAYLLIPPMLPGPSTLAAAGGTAPPPPAPVTPPAAPAPTDAGRPGAGAPALAAAALLTAALIGSLLLSLLRPNLDRLLHGAGEAVRGARDALAQRAACAMAWLREHLDAWSARPRRSLIAVLDRIGGATEVGGNPQRHRDSGVHEVEHLERLERQISTDISRLKPLAQLADERQNLIEPRLKASASLSQSSLGTLLVFLAATLLLFVVNAWILSVSGMGAASSIRPFGIALLPSSVSLLAVSAGIALFNFDSLGRPTPSITLLRAASVLLVLGLVLVNGYGYMTGAVRFGLAARMGLRLNDPLYSTVQHGATFLGAIAPMLLAMLGYGTWMNLERYLSFLSKRAIARKLDRNTLALERMQSRLNETVTRLEALRLYSEASPRDSAEHFPTGIGVYTPEAETPNGPRDAIADLGRAGGVGGSAPQRRSLAHLFGGAAVDVLLLALWGVLLAPIYQQFASRFGAAGNLGILARPAAAGIALVLGLAGFATKDAIWGSMHVTLWPSVEPGTLGRRIISVMAAAILVTGLLATLGVFVANQVLGGSVVINGGFAVLIVLAFTFASANLDAGLVSAANAALTLGAFFAWLLPGTASAFLSVLDALIRSAQFATRILATPGDRLRLLLGLAQPAAGVSNAPRR